MTVQTEISRSGPYAGAGTTGPFTVGFRFLDNSHLQVIRMDALGVNTTLTLNVDYSVSGAGADTGSVTLSSPLVVGYQLTIIRNVPFTQEADYVENDSFPAESHEMALDKLTMETQQLKEAQDRALTLPPTVSGVSTELPSPVSSAVVGWNSSADALVNVPLSSLATQIIGNTYQVDYFNGTGAQNSFTLSSDPGGTNPAFVSVGGVEQRPLIDYSVSGKILTFLSGAPPSGTNNVMVKYGTAVTTIGQASSVTGQTVVGTQLITAVDAAAARTAISAVGLTGNETVTGIKTFISSPIVPAPTTANQAARKADVDAVTTTQIISAPTPTVASNALTIPSPASPFKLDFRSSSLNTGGTTTVTGTPAAFVSPQGASYGMVNGQASSLVLIAMNNGGTLEYALGNMAGVNVNEEGLVSTTAVSASATSASVWYSTTARTNLPYRVIARLDSTQTTAGNWAAAMTAVIGAGGLALAGLTSYGVGQTWTIVTGSRAFGTTYYNLTPKAIKVKYSWSANNSSVTNDVTVDGKTIESKSAGPSAGVYYFSCEFEVPPGKPYVVTNTAGTLILAAELR